ncbi:hypothetical protein J7L13_01645 [bacterium]|nr:hypothetical protein [bacterium]
MVIGVEIYEVCEQFLGEADMEKLRAVINQELFTNVCSAIATAYLKGYEEALNDVIEKIQELR